MRVFKVLIEYEPFEGGRVATNVEVQEVLSAVENGAHGEVSR